MWGLLSKTRYKHVHVRLFRAIHGPLQFWIEGPARFPYFWRRIFKSKVDSSFELIRTLTKKLTPKSADQFGQGFPKLFGAMDDGAQASQGRAARSVFWKALPELVTPLKSDFKEPDRMAGEHK